jgi:hypothetical protein
MGGLVWLLTGGFLKGYRTYVLAGVAIFTALANYSVGDADLTATVTIVSAALAALAAAKHDSVA